MAKKSTRRQTLLTTTEILIMKASVALGEDAYGVSIFDAVRSIYPSMAFGSIYTSLERLVWKGFLETSMGESEAARGGRAKKYYRATDAGKKSLDATLETIKAEIVLGQFAIQG